MKGKYPAHAFIKLVSKENLIETSLKYQHRPGSLSEFLRRHLTNNDMYKADHIVIDTPRGRITVKCRAGICQGVDVPEEEKILHLLAM